MGTRFFQVVVCGIQLIVAAESAQEAAVKVANNYPNATDIRIVGEVPESYGTKYVDLWA